MDKAFIKFENKKELTEFIDEDITHFLIENDYEVYDTYMDVKKSVYIIMASDYLESGLQRILCDEKNECNLMKYLHKVVGNVSLIKIDSNCDIPSTQDENEKIHEFMKDGLSYEEATEKAEQK